MSNSIVLKKSAITQVNDTQGCFEIDLGESLCISDLYVEITTNSNGKAYLNFNEKNEPQFSFNQSVVKFKKNCDLPLTKKIRLNFHNDLQSVFKSLSDTAKITLLFYDENHHFFLKDVRKGIDLIYNKPLTYQLTRDSIGSVELVDVNSVTDEQINAYKKTSENSHDINNFNLGDCDDDCQTKPNVKVESPLKEEFLSNHNESGSLESQESFSKCENFNKFDNFSNSEQGITFRRNYSYLEQRFNNKYPQNKIDELKEKKGIFSWIKSLL